MIRDRYLQYVQPILAPLKCKNDYNEIVDKSIISSNNWLMYGCSKPIAKPYRLTHILDIELNDLSIRKFKEKQLIDLLSIRDKDESLTIPIKNEHKSFFDKIVNSKSK